MRFQMGTDEAGYGPNLGPLTITGTLWETADPAPDLYSQLAACVTAHPAEKSSTRLVIADSKKIFGGTKRLHDLELPVLALLYGLLGRVPTNWLELLEAICSRDSIKTIPTQSWLSGKSLSLPFAADPDLIQSLGDSFSKTCESANVKLTRVQCVPVFPEQFNMDLVRFGNKATLLSTATLNIVRHLLDATKLPGEIGCDKHGGRSKYAGLIHELLSDDWVHIGKESREISDYRFRDQSRDVTIRFESKGESFLPAALASMVSKYVRELLMALWNNFWCEHLKDLRPTQGYPQDAKRFKREIAEKQRELGIADQAIWRNK